MAPAAIRRPYLILIKNSLATRPDDIASEIDYDNIHTALLPTFVACVYVCDYNPSFFYCQCVSYCASSASTAKQIGVIIFPQFRTVAIHHDAIIMGEKIFAAHYKQPCTAARDCHI